MSSNCVSESRKICLVRCIYSVLSQWNNSDSTHSSMTYANIIWTWIFALQMKIHLRSFSLRSNEHKLFSIFMLLFIKKQTKKHNIWLVAHTIQPEKSQSTRTVLPRKSWLSPPVLDLNLFDALRTWEDFPDSFLFNLVLCLANSFLILVVWCEIARFAFL